MAASLLLGTAFADPAVPPWFDAAWHYRVEIVPPATAAPGSTVQLDADFDVWLTSLGVDAAAVDFDEQSPRLVRPGGTLAAEQEFTDTVYVDALDPVGNGRGRIRFILEDAPTAGAYLLYFDIVENGAKPGSPATVINGDFENSAGAVPTGWVTAAVNSGGGENNEAYSTAVTATVNVAAACSDGGQNGVDAGPNRAAGIATGARWHLLGYRDGCEDGAGNERVRLSRDIVVPAGPAAGMLEFHFQVQAFDGIANAANYDWFAVFVNGVVISPLTLGIDNTTAPALTIDATRFGRAGYGAYRDHGWKRARLDLSAFAGSTVNFRIESRHSANDNLYRAWLKVDDVVWSRADGTAGVVEGFGADVLTPGAGAGGVVGTPLRIEVAVDAVATVEAQVVDPGSTPVGPLIPLFDDGSHGDALAGDRIFTNDGSVVTEPSYTFAASDPAGAGWSVRARALDGSVSSLGATNGLLHRVGQPTTPERQANFFNVDEALFALAGAVLEMTKTVTAVQGPVPVGQPKAIPGAWLEYRLTVTNRGPDTVDADTLAVIDNIPGDVEMCVAVACQPGGAVLYDDTASPEPTGLSFDPAVDVAYSLDGIDFSYVPIPDPDGFDAAVAFVRMAPSGTMSAPGPSGDPEFRLTYRARLR